jgi:UDP-glucose:(heptosyl)LPS alpha-1,3-glucosyltransferase
VRIALITGGFGPGGGTAGQAWLLARGLVARGHEVAVWSRTAPADTGGVAVSPLPRSRRALWSAAFLPRAGYRVHALERAPGAEIVRASGGVHESWLLASRTTLMRTMTPTWPRDRHEARLDRQTVGRARLVVCNSLRAAGEVCGWHGVDPQRVRVVRNGVDLERFVPDPRVRSAARDGWGIGPGARVALFLGDGWHRKGARTAAAAFRRVAGPRDRLVVVGRGGRGAARALRSLLGERLVILGGTDAPERWLPGADVLLLPTRYDASANVVLEAMACGVPAVTTGRDGASELIDDRRLVVPDPEDVAGLSRAARTAWDAGEALRRSSRAVAERWPGSRMVCGTEQIYLELEHG